MNTPTRTCRDCRASAPPRLRVTVSPSMQAATYHGVVFLWIRNTAWVCSAIFAVAAAILAMNAVRESRLEKECRSQGQFLDARRGICVPAAPDDVQPFRKRHSWAIGVAVISGLAAATFGFWYYAFIHLPARMGEKRVRKRRS